MTTNNHPAHGPVSLDRLNQISEILSKAAAQSDGGNLGYAMADAVKVINGAIEAFGAKPVAYLYSASFERGHVEGELTDAPGCDMPVYTATPAPVSVPDELTREEYKRRFMEEDNFDDTFRGGWNACRAAMLRAGNSPVTPDGLCPCCGRKPLKHIKCSVPGCVRKHVAHGLCQRHYDMKRREDPEQVEKFREANRRFTAKKRAQKAAVQKQEVKSALEHGMQRYAGAMQNLEKGGD
ncbi:hypothetical protein ACMFFG_14690 [Citrobacter freundii]|uniref:hypothetical protein n=1 Tax=Citrobacter freundii TaxID=546 RepID=UPI003CFACBAE